MHRRTIVVFAPVLVTLLASCGGQGTGAGTEIEAATQAVEETTGMAPAETTEEETTMAIETETEVMGSETETMGSETETEMMCTETTDEP